MQIIPRDFYTRDTVSVAEELIGKRLIRIIDNKMIVCTITETEAYRSDDPACHAYRGKTVRNISLFGAVGYTYVYFCYGIHYCVNIVARDDSCLAGGVLIRGLSIEQGAEWAKRLDLDGPGKVTQGLFLSKEHNNLDLTRKGSIYLIEGTVSGSVIATSRIGISQAQEKKWRFTVV